jgi:multicomponent Na+:H+ antiporter subunit C
VSEAPIHVLVYALAAAALSAVAIHAFLVRAHLIRRIIALNMLGAGVFLLLIAIARRAPDGPPDPVPHAMVLTGIVVAISATAFALVLTRRIFDATGRSALPASDDEAGHDS